MFRPVTFLAGNIYQSDEVWKKRKVSKHGAVTQELPKNVTIWGEICTAALISHSGGLDSRAGRY